MSHDHFINFVHDRVEQALEAYLHGSDNPEKAVSDYRALTVYPWLDAWLEDPDYARAVILSTVLGLRHKRPSYTVRVRGLDKVKLSDLHALTAQEVAAYNFLLEGEIDNTSVEALRERILSRKAKGEPLPLYAGVANRLWEPRPGVYAPPWGVTCARFECPRCRNVPLVSADDERLDWWQRSEEKSGTRLAYLCRPDH